MFLLPNSKKWHHTAIKISSLYRYGMTIVAIMCILAVWFFFIYQPIQKNITYYTTQIKQLHKESQQIEKAMLDQRIITEENTKLIQKLASFSDSSVRTSNIAYIMYILEHAAAAGCSVDHYTVQQNKTGKKNFYRKTLLAIALQTTIEQLLRFLSLLKESEKMLAFQSLSLERQNSDLYSAQLSLAFIAFDEIKNPST